MTREEFTTGIGSVVRHVLTLGAGLLAAHGLAGGDELTALGGSIAVFLGTLGWSLIEKSKLLSAICENAPASELETLAGALAQFRANGANPLLIANIAQTLMAIANHELIAAHPELAPPPPTPAPAPVSPPAPVGAPGSAPSSPETVQ